MKFWSDQARDFLLQVGRQDLMDKGDDLGERVAALVLTALNRLNQYFTSGGLYDGSGGTSLLSSPHVLQELEEFVNIRLRAEIDALENLLLVFDDLSRRRMASDGIDCLDSLEKWYSRRMEIVKISSLSMGITPEGNKCIHVWSTDPDVVSSVSPKSWNKYPVMCLKTPNIILRNRSL